MDKPAERSVVKPVGGPGKVRGKEEAEGFFTGHIKVSAPWSLP